MIFIAAFQNFKVMGTCWGNITPASYARGDILDLWLALAGRLVNKKKARFIGIYPVRVEWWRTSFSPKDHFFLHPTARAAVVGKFVAPI